jgi:hypothetical protein
MVALPLFDVVMSSAQAERSMDVAGQLIESAVAEVHQIEKLDESLAPSDPTQFDRQTAALIRGMYEQWAHDVESLLNRIAQVEKRFGRVPAAGELRDIHGRTMAMLTISLDDMESGRRDIAAGRLLSAQEVRRELRLEVH